MPTVEYQIATSTDDGYVSQGYQWPTVPYNYTGQDTEYKTSAWYRWLVTLPLGAVIIAAYIKLFDFSTLGNPLTKVFFEKSPNPDAPTCIIDYLSRMTTIASTAWNGGFTWNDWNNSPSLVAQIQELIDAYDYSGGAYMQALIKDNGSGVGSYQCPRTWDYGDHSKGAILHIEYNAGAAPPPLSGWGTIYIVPPITNTRILPTNHVDRTLIGTAVSLEGSKGEYVPMSFVVHANQALTDMSIALANLVKGGDSILTTSMDLRVVKSWLQFREKSLPTTAAELTPELLLKDDAMVRVNAGTNEIKIGAGYVDIGVVESIAWGDGWLDPTTWAIEDNAVFQPVDIPNGENKQFWLTILIPSDAVPGTYTGNITLSVAGEADKTIAVTLVVLPITLPAYSGVNSLYYPAHNEPVGYPNGSISNEYRNVTQLTAELQDMKKHGITHPMVSQPWIYPDDGNVLFKAILDIVIATGFATDKLFLAGKVNNLGYNATQDAGELAAITAEVTVIKNICQAKGFTDIYFYGIDEAAAATVALEIPAWQAIHAGGGKVYVAGYHTEVYAAAAGNLDLLVAGDNPPKASYAPLWHAGGNKIIGYNYPQAGYEIPRNYRLYYGIFLWQIGYDGVMDWSYQGQYGNIWNEMDYYAGMANIHDFAMTYPTVTKVVDTIQWEGWREGVIDLKYIQALEVAIANPAIGKDPSAAQNYLATLKASVIFDTNLDTVRGQVIDYILDLTTAGGEPVPTHGALAMNAGRLPLMIGSL